MVFFGPMKIPVRLLLLASLALAPACRPGEGSGDAATTMFRGGPAHLGVYPTDGIQEFGGVLWRVQTAGPVRSSPAVADGRVFFGSADGHVYAVDLKGKSLWRTDAGAAVNSSPAVADGRVFVQSRKGEILALSGETGAVLWRTATGPDAPLDWGYESGDIYLSSPVVAQGKVVVGSGDGNLYALDAGNGQVRWRLRTGGRVRSSPAVADGVVFAGSLDGSLYAADLETGRLRWRFDTLGRSLKSGDFGFDRKSVQSSPAVADGTVYVGGRDGFLYAVEAATGRQRWRLDHQVSWVITSPAVREGRVYAGSSDAHFFQAVDARTGREVWRLPTPASVWSSPAVAGGGVYVGDSGGTLHAVDAGTGRERWTFRAGAGIYSSPVPVAGMLLAGSNDGALYALGAGAGGPLRRAVFWDPVYERSAWSPSAAAIRDELKAGGYEVLDAHALAAFLAEAVAGRSASRSVVAFAIDHLPPEIAGAEPRQGPFRRFLDAGGTVVWPGVPPLIWPRDPKTGSPGPYSAVNRRAAGDLLGVDFTRANFDFYGTRLTAAGSARGLRGWWLANWSVDPAAVSEVLAENENGLAAAWVKSYGGAPGTGFVMIGHAAVDDPALVQAIGDHRPR